MNGCDEDIQVAFRNPAWRNSQQIAEHRDTIKSIERYAAVAHRLGLLEDEIADDLNDEFSHIGVFSCTLEFPPDDWNNGRMVVSVN